MSVFPSSPSLHVFLTAGSRAEDTLDLKWELRFQLLGVLAVAIMGIIHFSGCIAIMGIIHYGSVIAIMGSGRGTLIVPWAVAFLDGN